MERVPTLSIEVFLAIAEQGSLRGAARVLGLRPPAISYQLKALEDRLGVALVSRTTRSTELTDAGRALLRRAGPAMEELRNAIEDSRSLGQARKGSLRLTLPHIALELGVVTTLAEFRELYPMIEIELSFSDAFIDILTSGFHAGVRLGDHVHEDMMAVRLTPAMKEVFFAAPSYFIQYGVPERPEDLLRHHCIRYRYIASEQIAKWQFKGEHGLTTIDTKGSWVVNDTGAVVSLAARGLGIGWLFRPIVQDEIQAGRLVAVLDEYVLDRPGLFLYYPKQNTRIEAFRVFVDFVRRRSVALG